LPEPIHQGRETIAERLDDAEYAVLEMDVCQVGGVGCSGGCSPGSSIRTVGHLDQLDLDLLRQGSGERAGVIGDAATTRCG
jgi:hypothetical protein